MVWQTFFATESHKTCNGSDKSLSRVAEFLGILGPAYPDGIHDQENRARHSTLLRADALVNEAARRRIAEAVGGADRRRGRCGRILVARMEER